MKLEVGKLYVRRDYIVVEVVEKIEIRPGIFRYTTQDNRHYAEDGKSRSDKAYSMYDLECEYLKPGTLSTPETEIYYYVSFVYDDETNKPVFGCRKMRPHEQPSSTEITYVAFNELSDALETLLSRKFNNFNRDNFIILGITPIVKGAPL